MIRPLTLVCVICRKYLAVVSISWPRVAVAQHMADRLQLLSEERDLLLHEKQELVDRLGSLEERQTMLQEREGQADYRGISIVR